MTRIPGYGQSLCRCLARAYQRHFDFPKIEAGKLDLDPINFQLRDSIDDTLKTLALRANQKGLELACHVLPEVPDALIGDTGRLVARKAINSGQRYSYVGGVIHIHQKHWEFVMTHQLVAAHRCVVALVIKLQSELNQSRVVAC